MFQGARFVPRTSRGRYHRRLCLKELQVDLQDELSFTESWMHDSPKNYQVRRARHLQPTQKLKAILANPAIRRFLIHYLAL